MQTALRRATLFPRLAQPLKATTPLSFTGSRMPMMAAMPMAKFQPFSTLQAETFTQRLDRIK